MPRGAAALIRTILVTMLLTLGPSILLLPAAGDLAGSATAMAGETCLACDHAVGANDVVLVYRGRRVVLHRGACLAAWNEHGQTLFASLQPRGALFQEPEEPSSPLRDAWFVFGVYVVVGLVAGASCAYLAVQRGRAPVPWFFAGLVGNVVALGVLLARAPADTSHLPAGIPPGLTKVPTTRAPILCPRCGSENHPAAKACLSCGASLRPAIEPETART